MAGTKSGGRSAAATNKTKYGSDFYAKIGAKGGKKGRTGGFAANRELARIAGAIGGARSRRGPSEHAPGEASRHEIERNRDQSLARLASV